MTSFAIVNQINLLLWKNFRLRRRRPFQLLFEILSCICIFLSLISVRNAQVKFRMDRCEIREKQMASLGPIPFIRDFLCTFNTTCYNKTQINWETDYNNDKNEFITFLYNFTKIYQSFPKRRLNNLEFLLWLKNNPEKKEMLTYSLKYANNNLQPIIEATNSNSSNIESISTIICGSNQNDVVPFLLNMNLIQRSKRSIDSCQSAFKQYFSKDYLTRIFYDSSAPIIFGKIYYTPDSEFTKNLIKKANITFEILDNLRLASIEWRLNFRNWFENSMNNSETMKDLMNGALYCLKYSRENAELCQMIYDSSDINKMRPLLNTLTVLFGLIEESLNCTELNKFVPVKSITDIEKLADFPLTSVFAGLVFNESLKYSTTDNTTFLNYRIRMPTNRIDYTKNFRVLDTFWTPIPRRNTLLDFKYYTSGFIFLQEALDQAFIELITGNVTVNIGSTVQIMPYPCFVDDRFIKFLMTIMPFILIIAWTPSVTIIIKNIVYEKENRLKEFMRIMGLSNFVHWLSWFLSTIVILIFPAILMTLILKYNEIIQYSSPAIVFILIFSYIISFICQSFMISVFFDNANIAAVAGGIIYFIFYLPFIVFINFQEELTKEMYYGVGLLIQVSFCNAFNFIGYLEQSTDGVQFSNLFDSTIMDLNFGVGHCMIMIWVDSIIYLLIAWYFEAIFPGKYGIPKPWYFFLMKNYWISDLKNDLLKETSEIYRINEINNHEEIVFENEPRDLNIGISINNLMKIFPNSKVPVIDNLNLKFFQSQITAFLGHNGAGKTTTISILTGMLTPTSGTAVILGHDIRYEMDLIREQIGLCPQHNILFGYLTVEDHIYFYGLLKGMTKSEIKEKVPIIVEEVGLSNKRKTLSKNLSGGMQRKLSIAMSFIGDSRIVFLDEPTAGVDPFARRGIWDLIMKHRRKGRTIILTTHHMDEADYLSDRIAIISQGKLKCCGSSVFLKKTIGDGYYLILEKAPDISNDNFQIGKISENGNRVLDFIRNILPDSKMIEETKSQWTIVLSQNSNNRNQFSILFEKLDKSLRILHISAYGLSDTTLEEVFLKVADDPSETINKTENERITSDNLETLTDGGNLPRPVSFLSFRKKVSHSKRESTDSCDITEEVCLKTGFRLYLQQVLALQIKRFHCSKRNIKGFLAEIVFPLLLIILISSLMKLQISTDNQPSMTITPWLMMPKTRLVNLNTFYRKENTTDLISNKLVENYRSDVGESGLRCMNSSIYQLENYKCFYPNNNVWSPEPIGRIPLISPECDCEKTGNQICSNPLSEGPHSSYRLMASSDKLSNLNGYNISDYLMKNFKKFKLKQYGGFQFILPSYFGQSCEIIGNSSAWEDTRQSIYSSSQNNNSNLEPIKFLNYFQRFFNLSGVKTNSTRIWINSKGYVSMPAYVNIFSNLLLRTILDSSNKSHNYGISVANHPLKYTQSDLMSFFYIAMISEVFLAIFVIFGLSFIPASFVIFLIDERVSGSKHQQFVSGINPIIYWVSNFFWDLIKYLIPVSIVIICFICLNYQSYIGTKNISAFVFLHILYGLTVIPHMYPFSFFISKSSTAFVLITAYNLLVGAATTMTTVFLDLLQNDDKNLIFINDILKKIFLIFPQYELGRGMIDLSQNYLQYNMTGGDKNYDAFQWDITGIKLFSLSLLFIFWWIIVFILEYRFINRVFCTRIQTNRLKNNEIINDEDFDVSMERERMVQNDNKNDILKVFNLTKIYNPSINIRKKCFGKTIQNALSAEKRKLAVNKICFGVKEGECFGLLGVNGAGKTTTFKMLTGLETLTDGKALINGYSISDNLVGAHRNMGFCPQFDALHSLLSCEEELYFYCRIRGIKSSKIPETVKLNLINLSLSAHAKKPTHVLSGGNKRKLSTAIAIIGNPKVIFLDEPTSGMDAGARRFLWNVIQKITNKNKIAVILTSHNMEECEVLCHRLTIMVNGQMKCIGSVQHLKSKFGEDYFVKIRLNSNKDQIKNREALKELLDKEFSSNVSLKDENAVMVQYRFKSSLKLSIIFSFFENLKTVGLIMEYSVSQTSLDEVFINFATNYDNRLQISNETMTDHHLTSFNKGFDNVSFDKTYL